MTPMMLAYECTLNPHRPDHPLEPSPALNGGDGLAGLDDPKTGAEKALDLGA